MQIETFVYIILAGIIALFLALFKYFTKRKAMSKLNMLFAFLRFLSIFSVLLLLINPKFNQITLKIEKPNLIIAVDNSSSIIHLNQNEKVINFVESLSNNEALKNKFNLEFYTFGERFKNSDSITFSENQTNINEAFIKLSQIYKDSNSPTLLISDGNQTLGNDYEFAFSKYNQAIYPVILGDTISYTDLRIEQLNVNKYAFLKNKFPVEAILVYKGNGNQTSKLQVVKGNTTVFSQTVNFNKTNNSEVVNFTLPSLKTGVNTYKATLLPINTEKNKINNSKNFAVEIIDQKTKIAIVSDFIHPDLGTFKKSIESNEQHSVSLLNSNEIINQLNDFQLVILYQPTYKFKNIFEVLNKENKNRFVVVGTKTDLNFLNSIQKAYQYEITQQLEDYQAELNLNYSPFLIDDINFESFPPLQSHYGSIDFKLPFQTILNRTVRGIATNDPLLATFETKERREAVIFGENIWKWRAQSYINSKSFNQFDDFIGKLVLYLASNKRRERLNLEYESFYNGSTNIVLKAQFFDKNYQFDAREQLNIIVKDKNSGDEKILPLILKNNNYEVDLSSLSPSEYSFTVRASNENISKSGSFKILEYNVEQQFLNANVTKLQQLSTNSSGLSYFIDNSERVISDLLNDNRYASVQKSNKNSLPLIDWKFLLFIIALSLSAEWFLRKYNGLI